MKILEHDNLKNQMNKHLKQQMVAGRVFLDRFCMIDEDSRKSTSYADPNYSGFYYHLSKYIDPENIVDFSFDLGLLPATFMISCKSVKNFLGFREKTSDFFSFRLGRRNIKRVFKGNAKYYHGEIYDKEFDEIFGNFFWDFIIFNNEDRYDKMLEKLEFVWFNLKENGIIVCENIKRYTPVREAFMAFSESHNRKPIVFDTRYGTGLVQK
jgi:hypothetical protein